MTRYPRVTVSNTRLLEARANYLDAAALAHVAEVGRVVDPRARYLRLLQAWVECLPHQPAKRRFVEGALARARRLAVRESRS